MASEWFPVLVSALLTPNPVRAGEVVRISVAAADAEAVEQAEDRYSNEFYSGEV